MEHNPIQSLINSPIAEHPIMEEVRHGEQGSIDMKAKMATKDLVVSYAKVQALKGVSLNIYPNEVTALIGPSGCGKSTFIRSLNRMNDTISVCNIEGQVFLDGENIYDPARDVVQLRTQVGMVIVLGSLERAGLLDEVKDSLNVPGTSLSGGQQQRLCIARAIAVRPDIILMDEPCSALDPIATKRIEELITELKAEYTIVIVTHSMQQARRLSDKIAYFHLGSIVEHGETAEVFENPIDERTADYVLGRIG